MIETDLFIPAPADLVYNVARDIEKFPEFLPDVESVVVTERDGARVLSEWVGVVREFRRTIRWTEEDLWDDAAHTCSFRAIAGDWDRYEGVWSFASEGQGTRVRLQLDHDFNVPLIGALIRGVLRKLVTKNCERMLEGLRTRVAQLHPETQTKE